MKYYKYTYTCKICGDEYGSDFPNDKGWCHICGMKMIGKKVIGEKEK